jgi:hypothetical protein
MKISTEMLTAIIIEFKQAQDMRALQEFELLLYEAACNYLTAELRNEGVENTA